jgi:hypothetical protein
MLQVIGLPFIFIPISTLNYVGVPPARPTRSPASPTSPATSAAAPAHSIAFRYAATAKTGEG